MHATRNTALALFLLLVTVTIAGCSALTDSPNTNDPTDTATPLSETTPTSTATQMPNAPSDTYTNTVSNLGENEKPHGIRLVNDRNDAVVTATIRITREATDYTVAETHNLSPGDDHYGVIDYKANYTVTVVVGNQNATERISVSTFDCNDSTTTFSIRENSVNVSTLSTTVECGTASHE